LADGTTFEIASENDAWRLLDDSLNRRIDAGERPEFIWSGWPYLQIDLPETPIPGSISPPMMGAFLEIQSSIYRSHAILSSGTSNLRSLNRIDKERFEFRVRVEKGSSLYLVDLQHIAERLGNDIIAKMTGTELVITVVTLAIIVAGTAVWTRLIDQRTDQRRIDSDDEKVRALMDTFKEHLEHDTRRYEMLTNALTAKPILKKIDAANEPSREAVLDALWPAPGLDDTDLSESGLPLELHRA
jgi:hypothetical protein